MIASSAERRTSPDAPAATAPTSRHDIRDAAPSFSVVICVYNDAQRLHSCLQALTDQVGAPPFEVIVVDDGSSDDPWNSVRPFVEGHELVLTYLAHEKNKGLSAARNTGIAACRGSVISFVDSDCVPPPEWAATIARLWERADDTTVALSGIVIPHETDTLARRYADASPPLMALEDELAPGATLATRFKLYLNLGAQPHGRRPIFSVVGANMSIRADALAAISGFDERIRFGGDEVQCCEDLRALYGESSIVLEPTLVMRHDFDPSMRDVFRRARSYGRGGGRKFALHGGHPELRPYPFIVLAMFIVTLLIRPKHAIRVAGITAILLAFGLWRRLVTARGEQRLESLLYPLVFAACEMISTVGFAAGWLQYRGGATEPLPHSATPSSATSMAPTELQLHQEAG